MTLKSYLSKNIKKSDPPSVYQIPENSLAQKSWESSLVGWDPNLFTRRIEKYTKQRQFRSSELYNMSKFKSYVLEFLNPTYFSL